MKRSVAVIVVVLAALLGTSVVVFRSLDETERATTPLVTDLDAGPTVMGPTVTLGPDQRDGGTAAQQAEKRDWFVSPAGTDDAAGTESNPLATVAAAGAAAKPGDTIVLMTGTHDRVVLDGVNGTAQQPIRIVGRSGASVTAGTIHNFVGFLVKNSSYLHISGIHVHTALYGILVERSDNIELTDMLSEDVGQTGIKVQLFSHDVLIERATIRRTGRKTSLPYTGEGIYLGSGGREGDTVHDVQIRNSVISETTAEAIDVKPFVYNVTIEGNFIHDIDTFNSGAVVVGIGTKVYDDPLVVIRDNMIARVKATKSAHADANCISISAPATVYNNVLYDCADRGILINSDFPNANAREVNVWFNTVASNGRLGDIVDNGVATTSILNNIGSTSPGNTVTDLALFVDPSVLDFRLRPEAGAALDQGISIDGVSRDQSGALRQSGTAPDYGAIELFQSQPTPSTTVGATPQASPSATQAAPSTTQPAPRDLVSAASAPEGSVVAANPGGSGSERSEGEPAAPNSTVSSVATPSTASATNAPASDDYSTPASADDPLAESVSGSGDATGPVASPTIDEAPSSIGTEERGDASSDQQDPVPSGDSEAPVIGPLEADREIALETSASSSDVDSSTPSSGGVESTREASPSLDAKDAPERLAMIEAVWDVEEEGLPIAVIVIGSTALLACAFRLHSLRPRRGGSTP